ncbi:MAG: alpha/beta hydrolase [Terriglobia bacterium]
MSCLPPSNEKIPDHCSSLAASAPPPGLEFTESMRGYFATEVHDDFERAAEVGRLKKSQFQFTLTMATDNLARALSTPGHPFHITGTVRATPLSPEPLTVRKGEFHLLAKDVSLTGTRSMIYQMELLSKEGRVYYFEGFKTIHEGLLNEVWPQTTTLYFKLYDGETATAPPIGEGILRDSPADFLKLLTTLRVTSTGGGVQRLATAAEFGKFFAGILWDTYGGIAAPPHYLEANSRPRKKRPLRAPAPETHFFTTADGVQLRFLRYRGGRKGPVILSHGIGVSSLIFRTDTIETNLVEFLVARGFDVWALDYRGSIELACSNLEFTADDVARFDYPAAVNEVQKLTGAPTVQMVVHCFGSVSFFMAMLKGLKGVRSAVSSQVATHLVTAPVTQLKCGLYVPEFLKLLGIESLNAYVNDKTGWEGKLYEATLRLYPMPPEQLCTNPVCHRITFMYAQVFEHQQLSATTHDALYEMFGLTNILAFEHLARMVRTGHIVTASGQEAYLPHLKRLAIPVAFVHGGENRCFLPESTELTYNVLCEANGKSLYSRHVIPGYGHADSILGRNAALDIYPHIARHLEATEDL